MGPSYSLVIPISKDELLLIMDFFPHNVCTYQPLSVYQMLMFQGSAESLKLGVRAKLKISLLK